jgi:hypothetical protein
MFAATLHLNLPDEIHPSKKYINDPPSSYNCDCNTFCPACHHQCHRNSAAFLNPSETPHVGEDGIGNALRIEHSANMLKKFYSSSEAFMP